MDEGTAEISDDEDHHRFVYVEEAVEAQLVYRAERDRLYLLHTEVPDALGGRGIAGRLVRAAVDRARRTGETVVPWCPYARRWLRDHPDEASGIAIDWDERPR
jgi:predicted GNAT family acetyltransferase